MTEAQFACPQCGREQTVEVPTDRCLALHKCTACEALITPKTGDCCVVCSYSAVRCPVSVRV
ncbi:MAG: GDCCVxC domain-containing (seleno)protein [bacterium]|nr:GDCCVxC domain-containing (seleno)protein [bacterium]